MEVKERWEDLEAEHDIYGDLESSIFTSSRPVTKNPDDAVQIESLVKANELLKKEVQKLKKENHALLNNMSSLYLTAKNEIDKKNFIISELQKNLRDTVVSKVNSHRMTKSEADKVLKKCEEAYYESHSKVTLEEIKRAINENKKERNTSDDKTKSFKFGNMSWYFVNHQNPCVRKEEIEFPIGKSDKNVKNSTIENRSNVSSSSSRKPTDTAGKPINREHQTHTSSSKPINTSKYKKENVVAEEISPNIRKSPRHLNNNVSNSRKSSRNDRLFGPSPSHHSRNHSSDRKSRSENIYKKHYHERKRSRERSSRSASKSADPSNPHSDRDSRNRSSHSSKRHRRDLS